jgi:hypothetical protein
VNESKSSRAAFYCVADEDYFLGAVAMLNSLRLMGHAEPVQMLDCGLTPAQCALLDSHVAIVRGPADAPPHLLKTVAPLEHRPAEVTVLIDADMIVTRPLHELIDMASEGKIVAFRNDIERFVPEWGRILDLGPARRRPYVSSGLVFLGGSPGEQVLRLMDDRQSHVDFGLTFYGKNDPTYPFLYPEQDVLNAILCTRVESDRIVALEGRLAAVPPFGGLQLVDAAALRCVYEDAVEPYVLHHFYRKPWLDPMYHGVYSRLLARLLLGPDVPLKIPEGMVPLRMRRGLLALAERMRVDAHDLLRRYLGEPIAQWLGARVEARRRRAESQ